MSKLSDTPNILMLGLIVPDHNAPEAPNILTLGILEILNILAPGALARDDGAAEILHLLALGLADELVLGSQKEPSQVHC